MTRPKPLFIMGNKRSGSTLNQIRLVPAAGRVSRARRIMELYSY